MIETGLEAGGGWAEARADTYREHVVAHVVGATVLGHFETEDALHMLLDIGFVWTVFVDGQMLLRHERLALAELDIAEDARAALAADFDRLQGKGGAGEELSLSRRAPAGCLVREASLYESGERRRLVVRGDGAGLLVESRADAGGVSVSDLAP
ncbi:MAG: hypothetical protein LC800_06240 [Acidobacteria bacterium]|nr:hypothetical protein [Acidobacteriota bacterium]